MEIRLGREGRLGRNRDGCFWFGDLALGFIIWVRDL